MSGLQLFILGLVVMLALAFWNWQRSGEQRNALQQSGFNAELRLGGSPELVLDPELRQFALVGPEGYQRYAFNQLQGAEIAFDARAEANFNYRIELQLSSGMRRVDFASQWDAERALARFNAALKAD